MRLNVELASPDQFIPVIGASGAIYGLLLAFGWLFPNRLIYIYFLFPIPARYFVILFGLLEFFYFSRGGTGGGIAHLTHLGGLLFGLSYMLTCPSSEILANTICENGLKRAEMEVKLYH
jgi:membrane associated rhomboid family serine protease